MAKRLVQINMKALDDSGIDRSAISWTVPADPEGNKFCLLSPR